MLQQAMIELKPEPKGFLIVKNNADRSHKILDAIGEIFNFHRSNFQESPVVDNIREEASVNAAFYESEETVFSPPNQTEKPNKDHRLIVISGNSPDKTYHLNRPKMMIGRDKGAQISIDDKSVSLYHSMICMKADECMLKDLNSKNGTLVNGHRVQNSQKLRDGDKITIGSTMFTFIHGGLNRPSATRKLFRKKHLIPGALTFFGLLLMSIFIFLNQTKASVTPQVSSLERNASHVKLAPGNMAMASSTGIGMAQQKISSTDEKPVPLEEKGRQLFEKSLNHYIYGDIALSYNMLEEILRLNLPNDCTLKTNALAFKDKIAMIYKLYEEGLKNYKANHARQAIEIWAQALKADQDIAGQTSSYIADQIAVYTGDILYQMAREAMDKGNKEKAQELCSQTFRVQENHEGCIALMNTISQGSNQ